MFPSVTEELVSGVVTPDVSDTFVELLLPVVDGVSSSLGCTTGVSDGVAWSVVAVVPPPIGKLDEPVDEPVSLLVEPPPVTGIADGSLVFAPDEFVELLLLFVVELLLSVETLLTAELLLVVVLLVVADGLLFVVELL